MPATATKAAPATADGAEAPKKSKKKLIIILLVVVLGAGGYIAKGMLIKTVYAPGQPVPAGQVDSTIPQLTVNLEDGHLVQVTVALQLSKVANASTMNTDLPQIEDAIITVFGGMTYAQLLKPAGRLQAKAQIVARVQKIVGMVDGAAQQVQGAYFTGFVIQ